MGLGLGLGLGLGRGLGLGLGRHLEVERRLLERGKVSEVAVGPLALEAVRSHFDERRAAPHVEPVRQRRAVRPYQHVRAPRRRHVRRHAAPSELVCLAE